MDALRIRKDCINFAKKAGLRLLKEFKRVKEYSTRKHSKAVRTVYDKTSEILIKKSIQANYPEHSVLSEETGYIEKDPNFVWIVDPLDGSGNFINRNPFFSVSVAFMQNQKLEIGAVYFPVLNELFFAQRNEGAFLNERKIRVSGVDSLEKSYIVTCEGEEKNKKRKARLYEILASRAIDIRKLGSGSLECAWVACGRADAYVTFKIPPWDVAAGILLVEEAGGRASDFKGNAWRARKTDLIVSNGKIHEKILNLLKNF